MNKEQWAATKKKILGNIQSELDKYQWDIVLLEDEIAAQLPIDWGLHEYTFEQIEAKLKKLLPGKFVYVGDNHIAVHDREGYFNNPDGSDANPQLLCIHAKPQFQIL